VLKLVIVPLRKYRSSEAYLKVWTEEGSPLLTGSAGVTGKLQEALGNEVLVKLGMTYGQPGVAAVLEEMKNAGVTSLVVLPLYPQFSGTTTEAVFDAVSKALMHLNWYPQLESVQQYHDSDAWVKSVADSIREFQATHGVPDKLIFSLHGIPERYVTKGDPYATQCEQSTRDIARELGLEDGDWLMTYQSRVGREAWLQPYTEETLKELGSGDCKHIQVACPGFAVDCLEPLEEIAMHNREFFLEAGGETFEYIPALNHRPQHIAALVEIFRAHCPE
jgi:ferrochelatase